MKLMTKKVIAIIISVVVLAGGGVAAAVLAGDTISNSFHLLTDSDEEYFEWLADSFTDEAATVIEHLDGETVEALTSALRSQTSAGIGGPVSTRTDICYGDEALLSLVIAYDTEEKQMLISVPTYKEGAIDFSGVFAEADDAAGDGGALGALGGTESLGELFGLIMDEDGPFADGGAASDLRNAVLKLRDMTPAERADLFRRIMAVLSSGMAEVKLEKGYSSYVDEITVKYNTVNLRYEKGDIYDVVAELSKLLAGEGIFADYEPMEELRSIAGDITLYINRKGEPVGVKLGIEEDEIKLGIEFVSGKADEVVATQTKLTFDVNETKITLNAESTTADGGAEMNFDVRANGLEVLKGSSVTTTDSLTGCTNTDFVVTASKMVSALIGLDDTIAIRSTSRVGGEPFLTSDDVIYDYSEALQKGYITIGELLRYVFRITDTLDNDMINGYLSDIFGSMFGGNIELFRALLDAGIFDGMNPFGEESLLDPM